MRSFLVLVALLVASAAGQRLYQPEVYGPPQPYAYSYATQDVEGSSTAEQSSDANGRVVGKYTMQLADGRQRVVTYWADQSGFHADVVTNELGTESKDPADVTIKSSALTGPEAAIKYESTRVRGRGGLASYESPVYAPAPVASAFAALKPVQARFFSS